MATIKYKEDSEGNKQIILKEDSEGNKTVSCGCCACGGCGSIADNLPTTGTPPVKPTSLSFDYSLSDGYHPQYNEERNVYIAGAAFMRSSAICDLYWFTTCPPNIFQISDWIDEYGIAHPICSVQDGAIIFIDGPTPPFGGPDSRPSPEGGSLGGMGIYLSVTKTEATENQPSKCVALLQVGVGGEFDYNAGFEGGGSIEVNVENLIGTHSVPVSIDWMQYGGAEAPSSVYTTTQHTATITIS